ncbi:MAG: hypothetical protein IJS58_04445 [Bacilli bacterium]|nr:hypothetical protein [Bacilli bacterium]
MDALAIMASANMMRWIILLIISRLILGYGYACERIADILEGNKYH